MIGKYHSGVTWRWNHAQDPTRNPQQIRLWLADKSLKHTSAHEFLMRYLDAHAPKAPTTPRLLVPTLAKNFGYYPHSHEDAATNMSVITHDLASKGYPNVWWKPLLRTHLHKWGLEHYALDA